MQKILSTPRLQLISGIPEILDAAIAGNAQLSTKLQVRIPEMWSEFGAGVLHYARGMMLADPAALDWWTYFPVHKEDQVLLGTCGYKGPPDDGMVEIGYEIIREYKGQGLATEMAMALIDNAFAHKDVHIVIAHTLAEENASGSILKKCGFIKKAEVYDEEDGLIWRWELKK